MTRDYEELVDTLVNMREAIRHDSLRCAGVTVYGRAVWMGALSDAIEIVRERQSIVMFPAEFPPAKPPEKKHDNSTGDSSEPARRNG